MQTVTLFNRSSNTLEGLWNGVIAMIPPGESEHLADAAQKYQSQNPLMGSEDPFTGGCEYLIACKEFGDTDFSPLEQSDANEKFYREKGEVAYERLRRFPVPDRGLRHVSDVTADVTAAAE